MLKVKIDLPVLERIRHYVALAPGEVSALGIVQRDDEDLVVTELFLPRQVCSAASTDMDPSDVAKIMVDLEAQGIDARTVRLWLHSHADMNCFWSGTDTETIAGLCNDGFVLSIVTNKKGAMLARVDVFQPIRFMIDKVPVEPLLPDFGLRDACKAEIEARVGKPLPPVQVAGPRRNGGQQTADPWDDLHFDPLSDPTDRTLFLEGDLAVTADREELEEMYRNGEISPDEYREFLREAVWP
jgi:proteasome lid subunit RPN8/RPN11